MTDLIVRELRLRRFTDAASLPVPRRANGRAAELDATSRAEPKQHLVERYSRRRGVDERHV